MKEISLSPEKRKDRRKLERNRVTLEPFSDCIGEEKKKICYAETRDLSMGGVRIAVSSFIPVNTPIRINLNIAGTRKLIKAFGIIRWIRSLYENEQFDCGLQFIDLSPETSLLLIEHLYGQTAN